MNIDGASLNAVQSDRNICESTNNISKNILITCHNTHVKNCSSIYRVYTCSVQNGAQKHTLFISRDTNRRWL